MRTILIILTLIGFSLAQEKVAPNFKPFQIVYNDTLVGKAAGTYSSAFPIKNILGTTTVFFSGDTTATVLNADSCLTVGIALKGNYKDAEGKIVSLGWGSYYTQATAYTLLDTINRAYINTDGTIVRYMVIPEFTGYSVADSAKFWFNIGVGDSLLIKVVAGSQ